MITLEDLVFSLERVHYKGHLITGVLSGEGPLQGTPYHWCP